MLEFYVLSDEKVEKIKIIWLVLLIVWFIKIENKKMAGPQYFLN